jgi:hypothetical protein
MHTAQQACARGGIAQPQLEPMLVLRWCAQFARLRSPHNKQMYVAAKLLIMLHATPYGSRSAERSGGTGAARLWVRVFLVQAAHDALPHLAVLCDAHALAHKLLGDAVRQLGLRVLQRLTVTPLLIPLLLILQLCLVIRHA